ncbi:protein MAIN-LIKE 1-like [Camellia sinensis]|uniref:protein MAIN-LIKE 1-like n=1 Tax=Camellia sinensis TaxID=4442 RepID=UPI001035A6CD|nr:protein MAIN-LIKE 1-like [Camellia sinensis]
MHILTQPFLRGPTDPSILRSFKSHVAATIWIGTDEREPLKCHNHSSKIHSWPWSEQGNNTTFVNIVKMSGLVQLARCTFRFVNKIIVSSFVEGWQPETNTFHLTVGEMTITLDHIGTILVSRPDNLCDTRSSVGDMLKALEGSRMRETNLEYAGRL